MVIFCSCSRALWVAGVVSRRHWIPLQEIFILLGDKESENDLGQEAPVQEERGLGWEREWFPMDHGVQGELSEIP